MSCSPHGFTNSQIPNSQNFFDQLCTLTGAATTTTNKQYPTYPFWSVKKVVKILNLGNHVVRINVNWVSSDDSLLYSTYLSKSPTIMYVAYEAFVCCSSSMWFYRAFYIYMRCSLHSFPNSWFHDYVYEKGFCFECFSNSQLKLRNDHVVENRNLVKLCICEAGWNNAVNS